MTEWHELDSCGSGKGQVVGFYEHDSELLGFIKCREHVDYLRTLLHTFSDSDEVMSPEGDMTALLEELVFIRKEMGVGVLVLCTLVRLCCSLIAKLHGF
jgi:hypothetical protein